MIQSEDKMEYRKLGRTGLEVSAIGVGNGGWSGLPEGQVQALVREALTRGVSYLDLAEADARQRDEVGAALDGQRDRAVLAVHLGSAIVNGQYEVTRDPQVAERFVADFLTRCHTDHIDVLFLHNCDAQDDYERLMRPDGLLGAALRLKREGVARSIGFSGHAISTSRQAVESGTVDVLMFPISLAGNAVAGKKELFDACVAHNVGLVAMKPYGGGKLLQQGRTMDMDTWLTGGASLQLERTAPITPVQCLSYVLAQTGVSTIVPGCQDQAQLAAALDYFQATEAEKDFSGLLAGFQQYVTGECVYCNHCLPCPETINIGQTIRLYEMAQRQMTPPLRAAYAALAANAADCVQCGDCEERCPFGVEVIAAMERAAALFG